MKRILIIGTLLLNGLTSQAEYRPLELYEMIIKAEKIVYGTIVELDSNYFILNIEGSLTSDSGTLKITKFCDWACAARWKEYQVSQRLLLFLTTWNGQLVSMSGGNEGELPIFNNNVYINSLSLPVPMPPPPKGIEIKQSVVTFETTRFEIYNEEYRGYEQNLQQFIKTVNFIRTCFNFDYGRYEERTNWKISCNDKELEQRRSSSKIIEWVYLEATGRNER